ncbi:single-stranded DNA-binding protein [Leucobacter luti]|uniref:Single-stranded DNA-binding protein n=1 Tax=Leucobacter luti TaxID=340320 RepID=A0A4R6S172_9MICO|nr:single-stranded DNA-binding protein [Leucobacter luti]MCW2289320.1 single-strand DNA-binding protein [Leucobacter luti]QYM74879.1 single-stranded DNA-binding protein [Leucobacter luti]TCK39880.1 single-strand binding protein [Leucobacter luti]TDP93261.1 single-strand binding protein [Leucobacter luti]
MAGEPLITVVGNLVADPEPRVSQAGKSWVTFRIASTPRVRDRQSGDWSDGEALWLGCRAYGEYADNIAASLTKGSRVIVQGRLTQRSYTDNQGQQRTSLDLEVEEIGPSLRFATTQISRGQSRGQVGGFGGGSGQPAGQSSWGQPAAAPQQQETPWGGQPQQGGAAAGAGDFGGGFDDEQPF